MNILLIGKPAAGKGTITQRLTGEGFVQLSTGDLLREEVARGTELGEEINALLKQGKFATDETIFTLVDNFLKENADKNIIFDGFPRNTAQAQRCLDMGWNFDFVFNLEVPDELVKERIVNRRVHPGSGRVYNLKTLPPKVEGIDDITGEPLVQRNDDQLHILESRLKNFNELTYPILAFLEQRQFNIITLDTQTPIKEQVETVSNMIFNKNTPRFKV